MEWNGDGADGSRVGHRLRAGGFHGVPSADAGFWQVDFAAPKGKLPIAKAFWEDLCLELAGDEPWFFVTPDARWTLKPSALPNLCPTAGLRPATSNFPLAFDASAVIDLGH